MTTTWTTRIRSHFQDPQRNALYLGLGLILIVGLVFVLVAGSEGFQLPEVKVAEAAQTAVAWIAGLFVIIAGGVVVVAAVRKLRWFLAILGALLVLIGLTLIGVSVGVPPAFEPIVGLFQGLVDLLNLLLQLAQKVSK